MNTKFTKNDIREGRFEVAPGLFARVTIEQDDSHAAPWKECDGHGPVTGWERRDKRPGERILNTDHGSKRFYDFAGAMVQAKAEGWGIGDKEKAGLAAKLGRVPTAGDILAAAVERDFEFLRGWCADEWRYVVVTVALEDEDGKELASDSLGGVEDLNEYDREQAAEMLGNLMEAHVKELAEAQHWAERDTQTTRP